MFKPTLIGVAAAAVAAGLASPAPTCAQDTQRIEIVGSNIKKIASETALPVTIVTREQIQRSPASSVQELLQQFGAVGQRGFETQASSSFVTGASTAGLRGLSTGDTLVLLNGRRIAPYANAQQSTSDGAVAFVDLNSLPLSAVDQIQILKDGASAVYGADAIAGVINIITRKDFQGFEVGTRFGRYDEKGGNEIKGQVTAGFGDIVRDKYNVLASLEVAQIDPIFYRDRSYYLTFDNRGKAPYLGDQRSSFSDYGNFAVVDGDGAFRRGNNCPAQFRRGAACRYDFGAVEQLQPDQKRIAGLLVGNLALTKDITAFGEIALNQNKTKVEERAPAMDTSTDFFQVDTARHLPLGTTRDLLRTALAQQVPAGLLTVPNGTLLDVRNRFTEFGPRRNSITADTQRLLGGLRGTFRDWDWEAAITRSNAKADKDEHNEMRKDVLADLILAGTVNLFVGPNKTGYGPARVQTFDKSKSILTMFDAKASGEIGKLAGGSLMMAAGVETRKEDISSRADPITEAGLKVGSAATGTNGNRDLKSGYIEFSLPFSKEIEVSLAARQDRYSDFGKTTNPKVSLRFQPDSAVLLRTSYGTAFKAPTLFQLYESQSAGGYQDLQDTIRCAAIGGENECDLKLTEVRSGGARTLGLTLKPEKSKNFTFGLVFEPSANTSVSVDYWHIKKTDAITQPTAATLIANGSAAVIRNPTVNGIPGSIIRVTQTYFNAFSQDVAGIDIDITRRWSAMDGDRFTAALGMTYLTKFMETRDPTAGPQNLLGNYNGSGANPRIKSIGNFRWDSGNWSHTVTANYLHGYEFSPGAAATAAQTDQPRADAFFTMDGQVAYSGIKNLELRLGIRNLLGENAPYLAFFPNGTDTGQYDSRGRFYYAAVNYKFR